MRLPVDARTERLAALYGDAETRLRALIEAAVARGAEGTAAYHAQQITKVRAILSKLQDDAVPYATQAVGSAYLQGAKYADETLGLSGQFAGVHKEAVNVLADNLVNRLNNAAVTVGRQSEDVFRRMGLEATAQGLIQGSTRREVSAVLKQKLVNEGVTGFVDKAGRNWSLTNYTKMVARTTTREAVSQGTANRMLEHGHDLVTISEHAGEDEQCAPYAGKTFSMTGKTPGYDVLDTYPPFHPNCIHVLTPASATFDAFERSVASDSAPEPVLSAATVETPLTPYDEAAARVRAVSDDFQVPSGAQYSIDRLAPNGLSDPDLDLPWGSYGETKRERISSIVAEAKARDHGYLTRVGEAVRVESDQLANRLRTTTYNEIGELNRQMFSIEDEVVALEKEQRKLKRAKADTSAVQSQITDKAAELEKLRTKRSVLNKIASGADREATVKILERVRPGYGAEKLDMAAHDKVNALGADNVARKAELLPKEWVHASNRRGVVRVKSVNSRAFYHDVGNDGYIEVKSRDESTALHELGHRIESSYTAVCTAEKAFYDLRTKGEALVKLIDLYPNSGYTDDEVVRIDKFTKAYMGKYYDGRTFELLTMGLQGVFYGDHNLREDLDYLHWMLGVLTTV